MITPGKLLRNCVLRGHRNCFSTCMVSSLSAETYPFFSLPLEGPSLCWAGGRAAQTHSKQIFLFHGSKGLEENSRILQFILSCIWWNEIQSFKDS